VITAVSAIAETPRIALVFGVGESSLVSRHSLTIVRVPRCNLDGEHQKSSLTRESLALSGELLCFGDLALKAVVLSLEALPLLTQYSNLVAKICLLLIRRGESNGP
jgi:hypothetical protein